jgi:hypothetical protein
VSARSPRPAAGAWDLGLRLGRSNAKERSLLFAGLDAAQSRRLEGVLLAAYLVDTSSQVRQIVEERLAARGSRAQDARPHPGYLDGDGQRLQVATWAADREVAPELLAGLVSYERGRDLLTSLSLDAPLEADGACLEEHLLALACDAPAELLTPLLALPFDLSGRLRRLVTGLAERDSEARGAFLRALAGAALNDAGVVSNSEQSAGAEAFQLWGQGLLNLQSEASLSAPEFGAFVREGASFGQGVVTRQAAELEPTTLAALEAPGRALFLQLGPPAQEVTLSAEAFTADLEHPSAEVRRAAWALSIRDELRPTGELLDAILAAAEREPGLATELVAILPAQSLGRGPVRSLVDLLEHPRRALRDAVSKLLSSDPRAATLAAGCLDPSAPGAPLAILAAQPPALASVSLRGYLEAERSPSQAARALRALQSPPGATWEAWPRWLRHEIPATRRAAREALLRLPPGEGASLAPLLSDDYPTLRDDAALVVACAWRFELAGKHDAAARLLLASSVHDDDARRAMGLLLRYDDAESWSLAWRFVVGGEGGGTRAARRSALQALLGARPPAASGELVQGDAPWAPSGASPKALVSHALVALLTSRDPSRVQLALSWFAAGGAETHAPSLRERLEDLLWGALNLALWSRRRRAWSAWWRRTLRRFLPRTWIRPPGHQRGRAARAALLAELLDHHTRLGIRAVYPALLEPLLSAPYPVGAAAARATVSALDTPLPRLLRDTRPGIADEAIRVGHPDAVQLAIASELRAGLRDRNRDTTRALRWARLRPDLSQVQVLAGALAAASEAQRGAILDLLVELHGLPGGKRPVRTALEEERGAAVAERSEPRLRSVVLAAARVQAWTLVERSLPALAWSGQETRKVLREALREATERGHALSADALQPLLIHPLVEVRTLAISLLRKSGMARPWPLVRPTGPGVRLPGTEAAKRFLGLCEDGYEASMLMSVERLLAHPSGEVARRALKLLNRQRQELATPVLLGHLADPELRQQILTTFSTWAREALGGGGSLSEGGAEQLEDARRGLRTRLAQLVEGPRGRVLELLPEVRTSELPGERAAALLAVGRLALEEERGWVAEVLAGDDAGLQRAACLAAASLVPSAPAPETDDDSEREPTLEDLLRSCARAREPSLRAAARAALVALLPLEAEGFDPWIVDDEPEVTLAALAACRQRAGVLELLDLAPLLADRDPRVRGALLRALSESPPGAPEVLSGALRDPVPEVRLEAVGVVAAWSCADDLAGPLGELLSDPSVHVSAAVLDLVGAKLGLAPADASRGALRQPIAAGADDLLAEEEDEEDEEDEGQDEQDGGPGQGDDAGGPS